MAVGDQAAAAGFALVADTDQVKAGDVEINRTRDYVAQVLSLILTPWSVAKGGTGANNATSAKQNLGISFGTGPANDTNGGAVNGNLYFQIIT